MHEMRLRDYLTQDLVRTDLQSTCRDDAISELMEALKAAGKLRKADVQPVFDAVIRRESLGSTAIGKGVALPHARVGKFDIPLVALGLSR